MNPNGVEICWLTGDAICISAFWPENQLDENVSFVVIDTCENYAEFIECFCIEDDVNACIDRISLGMLMNLYLAGKGAISCSIDVDETNAPSLEFYIRDRVIVTKDDSEIFQEVEEVLKTPEEFIDYTRRYFKFNKDLPGYAEVKKSWPWKINEQANN